ncbi:MAG: hypothetical protein HY865_14815 [Chloroflexi bacterium]|nr:hypothetical protein [Chloroflexota bacterium]
MRLLGARKPCQAICSLRRPRHRIYPQQAAGDGGLSETLLEHKRVRFLLFVV